MKKMLLYLSIVLILFFMASCSMPSNPETSGESVALAYEPLSFKSIDELNAEKDLRKATTDEEADPQELKTVDTIYQFAKLPDKISFSEYAVSKAYVASYYTFQSGDTEYLSSFAKTGIAEDDLSLVALTVFRSFNKAGFDEFVNQNKAVGKIVTLGDMTNVFYFSASYEGKLMQKNYDFMYLDKYMRISVPGNFSDDMVISIIKNIQKLDF